MVLGVQQQARLARHHARLAPPGNRAASGGRQRAGIGTRAFGAFRTSAGRAATRPTSTISPSFREPTIPMERMPSPQVSAIRRRSARRRTRSQPRARFARTTRGVRASSRSKRSTASKGEASSPCSFRERGHHVVKAGIDLEAMTYENVRAYSGGVCLPRKPGWSALRRLPRLRLSDGTRPRGSPRQAREDDEVAHRRRLRAGQLEHRRQGHAERRRSLRRAVSLQRRRRTRAQPSQPMVASRRRHL